MAYGQKNYNEMIGGGNGGKAARYTIRQVGCFLTMFSNLLERAGKSVDPLSLNRTFINRGIFIDIDDGVRDDLGWQSITAYDGQITVKRVGTGTPPDNKMVGLKLKLNSAVGGFHFVLFDHFVGPEVYILDSWDGCVKSVNAYGPIVQWCEFGNNSPIPVAAYVPQTVPPATGEELILPPANSWAIYRLGTAGRKGTSDQVGSLAPYKFTNDYGQPGLNYDVLGHPMANYVTIKTRDYGVVNIYVASETLAIIRQKAAPTPAPVPAPTPPAPAPASAVAAESVPVTVTPSNPEKPAAPVIEEPKPTSIETQSAGKYRAKVQSIVRDFVSTQPNLVLPKDKLVIVGGSFMIGTDRYFRTKKSIENDWWYGIKESDLELLALDHPIENEEDDNKLFDGLDLKNETREFVKRLTTREHLVSAVARLQALFVKIKLVRK